MGNTRADHADNLLMYMRAIAERAGVLQQLVGALKQTSNLYRIRGLSLISVKIIRR